jgi:hypothetical protein
MCPRYYYGIHLTTYYLLCDALQGVLQQPWIRSTIFTYPFKLEIGIWMGPQDSHANIMCPTQSINRMHLCHNMFCQPLPFVAFSLPFLVLCFFIKFGMVYSLADT